MNGMRLISPGSLAGPEKVVFENLKPWFPSKGVCVNVMLGSEPWDMRPLILIDHKVYLYRFSRPSLTTNLHTLANKLQSFANISGSEMRIKVREDLQRLVVVRPFYHTTLADILVRSESLTAPRRLELVSGIFEILRSFEDLGLVHGHLSPTNIVEVNGALASVDPCLGVVHSTTDAFIAPEISGGAKLTSAADLYGLGLILSAILGEHATPQQSGAISRLCSSDPDDRPRLNEIERLFVHSRTKGTETTVNPGKVLRNGSTKSGSAQSSSAREDLERGRRVSSIKKWLKVSSVATVAALVLSLFVLKQWHPAVYNDLVRKVEFLSPPSDVQMQLAWKSNEKGKMSVVAEAAIRDHSFAAERTIVDDTMSGENRPGVNANLLRVALSDLWGEQLSDSDRRAALALSVVSLYPEGVRELPPLSSLHPGVILAITGHSQVRNPSKHLAEIGIEKLVTLPAPIGPLFDKLRATGSKHLGEAAVIGLAGIISGNPPSSTLEAYIGTDSPLPLVLARVALVLPIVAANDSAAAQIYAILRDRGGEIGQTLSWFDIDSLGVWSGIKSAARMRILLGDLDKGALKVEQYADLLAFPLADVRRRSAEILKGQFLKGESDQLFVVLSGEQSRLSREQTIALVTALGIDVTKRAPYISLMFQLNPSPEAVLLTLMARANRDSSDVYNLEAARYLRKNNFFTTTDEMLQILAHHPEPLARSLAYARLSGRIQAQRSILEQRLKEESDENLLEAIRDRLK